jgi:type I restriction-modification system DNA methylase subunit
MDSTIHHHTPGSALIEADLVDRMVALPGNLFYSTTIEVCLWFLAKNNAADAKRHFRDHEEYFETIVA